MALTFDPQLRPTDDLRGNGPTIYGSYLYPTDLLRADRRDIAFVEAGGVTVATILASGIISLNGAAALIEAKPMTASGDISLSGTTTLVSAKRIRANGTITVYGTSSMQTIAQMQASGAIQFTGSASGAQRLPNVGTVQVRSQVAGIRIWTESL